MRVLRWVLGGLVLAALAAFVLGLLAPRRRLPATPVPTYVAPPPAEDSAVTVAEAVPLDSPDDPDQGQPRPAS